MNINHMAIVGKTANITIGDTELAHPETFSTHSKIGDMYVSLTCMPGNTDKDWICLSVFVDGKQHVIYSGTPADAPEFFKRFPRN